MRGPIAVAPTHTPWRGGTFLTIIVHRPTPESSQRFPLTPIEGSHVMRTPGLTGLTLSAAALVLLGGCEKAGEQAAAAEPAAPRVVHVVANDFAFEAPDTVAGGLTTIHMMNHGKELH